MKSSVEPIPMNTEHLHGMQSKLIAVDFDGTIVTHEYPKLGISVPWCIEVLKRLMSCEHRIILYTMRTGKELQEALAYLYDNGIELYAANNNPSQDTWAPNARKVYAHHYIDDAALGCPLVFTPECKRPYVNWYAIECVLENLGVLHIRDLES